MELINRIQIMEDIEAIKNLKHLYCYLADEAINGNPSSWDALLDHFTEDAKADFGPFGVHNGKKEIEIFYKEVVSSLLSYSAHMVSNPMIRVTGDAAEGEWYVFVPCTLRATKQAAWLKARYDERYVKIGGQWKWKSIMAAFDFFTPYDEGWSKKPFFS